MESIPWNGRKVDIILFFMPYYVDFDKNYSEDGFVVYNILIS